jgi:Flp pilus assembly protein TadG
MRTTKASRERGTQLVELAIVMPLLLLLAAFMSEGAGFIRMSQALSNAAREGARLSSAIAANKCADAACSTDSTVQDGVLKYLCENGVPNQTCTAGGSQTVTVTVNQGAVVQYTLNGSLTNMTTSVVTVERPYPLPFMHGIPFFTVPTSVTMRSRAQFRNFYF